MKSLRDDVILLLSSVFAFLVLVGVPLFAFTSTAHAQGSDVGTLPVVHKVSASVSSKSLTIAHGRALVVAPALSVDEGSSNNAALTDQPASYHTSWQSHGQTHTVDVPQGVGEDDAHWAARCANKVAQLQRVFPRDP